MSRHVVDPVRVLRLYVSHGSSTWLPDKCSCGSLPPTHLRGQARRASHPLAAYTIVPKEMAGRHGHTPYPRFNAAKTSCFCKAMYLRTRLSSRRTPSESTALFCSCDQPRKGATLLSAMRVQCHFGVPSSTAAGPRGLRAAGQVRCWLPLPRRHCSTSGVPKTSHMPEKSRAR